MHPELTQYLRYAEALATRLRKPAQTVREAEAQQHRLKECLRLLRRAIATAADADLQAQLGRQLRDLKRRHFYAIIQKLALVQRATEGN
jgi:hypothetical protein